MSDEEDSSLDEMQRRAEAEHDAENELESDDMPMDDDDDRDDGEDDPDDDDESDSDDHDGHDEYDDEMNDGEMDFASIPDLDDDPIDDDGVAMHMMEHDDNMEASTVIRHLMGSDPREIRIDPGAIFPEGVREFLMDSGDRGAEVAAMFSAAVGAAVGVRGEPPLLHLTGSRDGPFHASLLEVDGPGSVVLPGGSSGEDARLQDTDMAGVHPLLQRPRPSPSNQTANNRAPTSAAPIRSPSRRRDAYSIHHEVSRRERAAAAILQEFDGVPRARIRDMPPYDTLAMASGASCAPIQSHLRRERDRAVPVALFNRWTYDPPGNGGIDPTPEEKPLLNQENRTSLRPNDPKFNLVHNALDTMLSGMRDEEGIVRQALRNLEEQERRTDAEEAEGQQAVNDKNAEGDRGSTGSTPRNASEALAPTDQSPGYCLTGPDDMEITPQSDGASNQANFPEVGESEIVPAVTAEQQSSPAAPPSTSAQNQPASTQEPNVPVVQRRMASEAEIEHARLLGVSERAAHRAAQIGISLQTPADMNPSNVEIATRATGIDPTFLAALPEEMRSEVLTDHFSQLSAAASASAGQGGNSSDELALNQEFLAALPPNLRAEAIEQEANILAQREERNSPDNEQQRRGQDAAQEMDNASFLATLAPELRREILVTCDEQFLATLPQALSEEARLLRMRGRREPPGSFRLQREGPSGVRYYVTNPSRRARSSPRPSEGDWRYIEGQWVMVPVQSNPSTHSFEMDEGSVAAVLKLLYVHRSISSSALFRVIFFACKARLNRTLVIDLVTKILIHLVFETDSIVPPDLTNLSPGNEDVGSTVSKQSLISRCLELLIFLAKRDGKIPELIVSGAEKDKAEDTTASTQFTLLTGLLRTQLFQKSSTHLELLIQLLAAATVSIQTRLKAVHLRESVSVAARGALDDPEERPEAQDQISQDPTHPSAAEQQDNPTDGRRDDSMVEDPKPNRQPGNAVEKLKPLLVPELPLNQLESLASVLSRQGCSEKTYHRVLAIFTDISNSPENKIKSVIALQASLKELGKEVKADFDSFLSQIAILGDEATERKIADFSASAGSSELKFLRVSKAVAALVKISPEKVEESVGASLHDLWNSLGDVLDAVGCNEVEREDGQSSSAKAIVAAMTATDSTRGRSRRSWRHSVPPALARLSPVIEAFFVLHASEVDLAEETSTDQSQDLVPVPSKSTMECFVERHRFSVNMMLRANPALLEGSFRSALKHAHCIDFDNKKAYFRSLIRQKNSEVHASTIRISVRRDQVFEDSYHALRLRTADEMKGRLHVQFAGEEGIDAGGVTREWYTILARKIFDLDYALFTRSAAKSATYQPNTLSFLNEDHLGFFKFVGKIMAKAIFDGQLLDAYFTRSFYKHILRIKPNYHDIEALDPEYYKSLLWMLSNDITGVLDLTMSAEDDQLGQLRVVDLVPSGRDIAVTEENKQEYVKLVTELRTTKAIAKQIEAFLSGFHEIIPAEDVSIFNELELELLMSGLPDIDITDLKANIEYTGYTVSSPQVNWFWRTVSQLGNEDLARLIMFVTGTSKVPLEGFAVLQGMNGLQKFQIHKVAGDSDRLPSAHTCFNQVDLPEYSTFEKLQDKLLIAIREGAEGFGFG